MSTEAITDTMLAYNPSFTISPLWLKYNDSFLLLWIMLETIFSTPFLIILIFPVITLTVFVIGLIKIDIKDLKDKQN